MRKTLIALILVLPMVFVLVIFTATNAVSLGVNIAVNGITIRSEGMDEEGTLLLDMADKTSHTVTAEISPGNATEKGYALTSSDPELVDVTKDGVIVPKKEGTAEITAKSNDKSFTDTMSVVVVSSKPYDFDFTLLGEDGENLLTETDEGYEATLPTGTYTYGMDIYPLEYTEYKLEPTGEAEVERGTKSLYLPFSGDTELAVTVPDDSLISPSSSVENLAWLKSYRVAMAILTKLNRSPTPAMNSASGTPTVPVAARMTADAACEIAVTIMHRKIFEKNTVL